MGMNFLAKSSSLRAQACQAAGVPPVSPDPDPKRFTILKRQWCTCHNVLLVHYEGCTTFGGNKVLLVRGRSSEQTDTAELDPHLLGPPHPVMARFEPTRQGWAMAVMCARMADEMANMKPL